MTTTQKNIDTNKEKPKIDAKKPLVIELSKRDAVFGSKKDHHNCAIARACRRIPNVIDAQISRTTTYLEYEDKIVRYANTPALEKRIRGFDDGKPFPPGTYEIRPYGKQQRLGVSHVRAPREKKDVADPGRRKVKIKISKAKSRRSPKHTESLRPRHRFASF